MIPLRKEIVYKEDIPPEYLQKKANGPFLVIRIKYIHLNKNQIYLTNIYFKTNILKYIKYGYFSIYLFFFLK